MAFDVVQRYAPIVKKLTSSYPSHVTVLEVGGGDRGLSEHIQARIVGCDVFFGRVSRPANLDPVLASVTMLPFREASFDVVVCVDMLEHINPGDREKALRELYRTANRLLVFACPSGVRAKFFEGILRKLYALIGRKRLSLEEHKKCGLPSEEEINQCINRILLYYDDEKKAQVEVINNANVYIWFILMILGVPLNLLVRLTGTRWLFKSTAWVLGNLNFGDTYRKIYFVAKK